MIESNFCHEFGRTASGLDKSNVWKNWSEDLIDFSSLDKFFSSLLISDNINSLSIIFFCSPVILFFNSKYKFFISTATPQKKVNQILKEKNLHKYFNKIYGYPKSKKEHIYEIKKNKR